MPPHLAGRQQERAQFKALLQQEVIITNPILTGLRGVGKTVLLEALKPMAQAANWLWVGTDLSESASISETNLVTRVIADIATVASTYTVLTEGAQGKPIDQPLTFDHLLAHCNGTGGLMSDKLRATIEMVYDGIRNDHRGIIFAYDEAQNLDDHAADKEFPLSVLIEVFQYLQRKKIPVMLLLTGLPTLQPKLVEARTYSERMFTVLFLERLTEDESREAITKPISQQKCPVSFSAAMVNDIIRVSGGYPYFIQFICREIFDVYLQSKGNSPISMESIVKRLDTDFFAGRWSNLTDRQQELMQVIARLPGDGTQFSVKEIVAESKKDSKPFGASRVNQMLNALTDAGLVYKTNYGKYSFAVPMLKEFITRQLEDVSVNP